MKWICGFANAQGGKIYIGTDDNGTVIGVQDSKKLLEDIMVKFTPLGQSKILKDQNVLLNDPLNVLLDDSLEKIVLEVMREKGIIERIGSRKSGQWIVK